MHILIRPSGVQKLKKNYVTFAFLRQMSYHSAVV